MESRIVQTVADVFSKDAAFPFVAPRAGGRGVGFYVAPGVLPAVKATSPLPNTQDNIVPLCEPPGMFPVIVRTADGRQFRMQGPGSVYCPDEPFAGWEIWAPSNAGAFPAGVGQSRMLAYLAVTFERASEVYAPAKPMLHTAREVPMQEISAENPWPEVLLKPTTRQLNFYLTGTQIVSVWVAPQPGQAGEAYQPTGTGWVLAETIDPGVEPIAQRTPYVPAGRIAFTVPLVNPNSKVMVDATHEI